MKEIKKVTLSLESMGNGMKTAKDWLLVVETDDKQERNWLVGSRKEVERIIEKLRKF